jgi:LemA protein
MGSVFVGLLVLVGLGILAALFVVGLYNKLVLLRNRAKNAFAQIDVQLKRRYDLIPNLVETAKAYLKHERETLEAVIQARNAAVTAARGASANPTDGAAMRGLVGAETQLAGVMTRFMALAESYPDLKADSTMRQLSEELTSTENKIAFARQAYNDAVTSYNTARESFPTNVVAGTFNFQAATLFEITAPAEREPVKVSF